MKLSLGNNQHRRAKISLMLFALGLASATTVYAQKDSTKKGSEPVENTFRGPFIINMPTNEIIDGFEFSFQHRFGEIVPGDLINNFFGMDLGAIYRLSIGYPIIKDMLQVELGRTNDVNINGFGKTLDLAIKYQFLRQTEKNEMPISVALFVDPCIATSSFPSVPANSYDANGTTPFAYKFADRLQGSYELIITRKFTKNFSFELTPDLIYQNLVPPGRQNATFNVQAGLRYKFNNHSAILVEYSYVFNSHDSVVTQSSANSITRMLLNPASIGVEFSTAGHIFQIMLSSSQNVLSQDIYTEENADYFKGRYYLGFNITRIGF